MATNLAGRRVVVTGGAGFLGSFVVARLLSRGADVFVPRSRDYDLTQAPAVERLFNHARPEVVIHLAARVGGIGANQVNSGGFFYENMAMGLHVVHGAMRRGVEKLVLIGTSCSYPKVTSVPFREEDLWGGFPEDTNAPYGVAKRALVAMVQAYRLQYRLNGIALIPANLYGPRDNFDLETSHVIPALIRKFVEARERGGRVVTAWGTGQVSREFLYVEDAAEGIVLAAERYDGSDPVNLGTGREVLIRDLVEEIRSLVGFKGDVEWDSTRPDGQPRRCLDTSGAEALFGFRARTPLRKGLRNTINWYLEHR
ncbi:MAG: GDP-L-fucose synthase [bacterium]|nr:GDP-L-fucose synthase [bacterium]